MPTTQRTFSLSFSFFLIFDFFMFLRKKKKVVTFQGSVPCIFKRIFSYYRKYSLQPSLVICSSADEKQHTNEVHYPKKLSRMFPILIKRKLYRQWDSEKSKCWNNIGDMNLECLTNKDVYITGKRDDCRTRAMGSFSFFLFLFFLDSVNSFFLALILIVSAMRGNFRGHALLVGNHHALG